MKNLSILICSLILASMGITACSKDGSGKQPNFRDRNQPFGKTRAGESGEVDPHKPVNEKPREGDDSAADPLTPPATTNKDLIVCDLLTDASQNSDNACDAVRVATIDGQLGVLKHQTAIYNQWKPVALKIESEDDTQIIGKFNSTQTLQARKLKVLQIMKNDEEVSVPDEMKFQDQPHKSNENLDNIVELFKNIKLKPDEHLLVLTNIDALKDFADQDNGSNVQRENDFLKNNKNIQLDLTFADSNNADDAIAAEQAFLASHVAQLSYTLKMTVTDGIKDPVVTVITTDENGDKVETELLHDHFKWEVNPSTKLLDIRATRLEVFNSHKYDVVVTVEK